MGEYFAYENIRAARRKLFCVDIYVHRFGKCRQRSRSSGRELRQYYGGDGSIANGNRLEFHAARKHWFQRIIFFCCFWRYIAQYNQYDIHGDLDGYWELHLPS